MGIDTIGRRAAFLDRDGVLNRAIVRDGKPYPPRNLAELEILPGVEAALTRLRDSGFYAIVVTNQPDVARGTQLRTAVEEINESLKTKLRLDGIRVCYHDDRDGCTCRKPQPGLILEAARDWQVDLAGSFMVGDRWRDIEAGRRAGCGTIFIDYGYSESPSAVTTPDYRAKSLLEAADWMVTVSESRSPITVKGGF